MASAPIRVDLAAVGAMLLLVAGSAVAPEATVAPEAVRAQVQEACMPAEPAHEEASVEAAPARTLNPIQQALVHDLSRRYLVAAEPTEHVVYTAYRAAEAVGLDPLLVLAVISIESRFNPIAYSVAGAKGLMQIIPRFHLDKLDEYGGEQAVLDPESNILVGARILQEYVRRTGSLEAGLQFYNGASWDGSAKYAGKVLGERNRLEQSLRAALPPGRVKVSAAGS